MGVQDFHRGALERGLFKKRGSEILPSLGAPELTTSASTTFESPDPYAEGTAYGQAETGLTVKDPYKPLTHPKKKPEGVYKV